MALQRITTKEPTEDMLEVAITAFNLALDPNYNNKQADAAAAETNAEAEEKAEAAQAPAKAE